MPDVVVLGSLNMDLVVRTDHIPRPGETIHGQGFTTIPGGKGANQAAAIGRIGASVEMVGRVGQDAFGPELIANMRNQGVGVTRVVQDAEAPTGIALIPIAADGENCIIVAAGANNSVGLDDLADADSLLAQAQYLVMQFEVPLDTVRAAIARARDLGVRVVLNPAPAYAMSADDLEGVYCLVANETEAETLTGIPVTDLASAEKAGQALLAYGIPVNIITLGAQGALLVTGDEVTHVSAQEVEVVDTTAAGDSFVGGLVAGFLRDMPLVEAVRYATCAGTLATTVFGAQTSIPSKEQVDALYAQVTQGG